MTPWAKFACPPTHSTVHRLSARSDNFPISGQTLESAHIRALALVKKAAATANEELQVLDAERARHIREAADL